MRRLLQHTRRATRTDVAFGLATGTILFGLCAVFALSTPIGSGPDEPAHIIRAASVVRGDPGGAMTVTPGAAPGQPTTVAYDVTVPHSYAEVGLSPTCYAFKPDVAASCAAALPADDTPTANTTYVGSYPPAFYAVTGIPTLFLPAHRGVLAMRLVVAAMASALLALGMVSARRLGGGLLVSAAAVVITPMTIYLCASVSPSGIEISAGFAAWLTTMDLLRSASTTASDRLPIVAPTIAAVALVLTRPSGFVVLGVVIVCVAATLATRPNLRVLVGARSVRVAGAVLLVATLATGGWILYAQSFGAFVGTPIPGLARSEIVRQVMASHGSYVQQMVGVFGWLDAPLPDPLWRVWTAVAMALVVAGLVIGSARHRLGIIAAIVFGIIAPPLSQITTAERFGYIWAGRYQLPFAMGAVLLAGHGFATRVAERRDSTNPRSDVWSRCVLVGRITVAVLVTVGLSVAYVVVMQRFGTGMAKGQFEYLDQADWHPPLPSVATTAAAVLLAAIWGLWTLVPTSSGDAVSRSRPASIP